jgi:orotate phosphoribosyltransferase
MEEEELRKRVRDAALLHGRFTLRSGRVSSYYLDKYRFETDPVLLRALGERLGARAAGADRIAGAELGAVPLAAAAAMASGIPALFVRGKAKDHGTAQRIEGAHAPGERVVLVEDVVTSGGQALDTAQALADGGLTVWKVMGVVDRAEGAVEAMRRAGWAYEALMTAADLGLGGSLTRG